MNNTCLPPSPTPCLDRFAPVSFALPLPASAPGRAETSTPRHSTIVHVPQRFVEHEWGGVETLVLGACHQQQRAGWKPAILTTKALTRNAEEHVQGVPVRRFNYCYPYLELTKSEKEVLDKKGGNLLSLPLFVALMREPQIRLFHAHSIRRLGGMVRTAARLRKKPFVVTLHGGVYDVPSSDRTPLIKPIQRKLEWGMAFGALFGSRRVLQDADMVICASAAECELARRDLPHGRIAHLPNGVDCARFARGDGAGFRDRHGIPQNAFVVMNISRLDAQKNQMMLLQAFRELASQRDKAHLVIIGTEAQPGYAAQLRGFIQEHGLGARVHLLPGIKNGEPELVDAYHACDVFVLPSVHEPFGIVVLEAWSAGKPVIATDVGGLSSLITRGQNGFLIDPQKQSASDVVASRLGILSQSRNLCHFLGENGRREARSRYDWSQVNAAQEELYQKAEAFAAARHTRKGRK